MAGDIRLILTDIDGTILPYGQRVVGERTRRTFHRALEAGIRVGPASGRGFSHIPASFAGDAELCATCLAANGMQVYLDGRLVVQKLLEPGPLCELTELVRPLEHCGLICFEDGVPLLVTGDRADLEQSFPVYARAAREVDGVPDHAIEKANVFVGGDMARTLEVVDHLRERFCALGLNVPMAGFVNTTPLGWSKASGIDVLCEELSITLDQVVVFGDGGNDVEMVAHVPHSVTVAEAVPEAVAASRHHIGRCADDAVADLVDDIIARRWPTD